MTVYILPFGKIKLINPHIAELIINEDVIIDVPEVQAYYNLLRSHLKAPFSVLINKEYAYSYTFKAQIEMGRLEDIVSRAVVVHNKNAEMAIKVVIDLNREHDWNIRVFNNRQSALKWLLEENSNTKVG